MANQDKLEFYQDAKQGWRWRLTAANGNIRSASSEGFKNKEDCEGNAQKTGEALYRAFHPENKKS